MPITSQDPQLTQKTLRSSSRSTARGSWNMNQKKIMLTFFKKHVEEKMSPKKQECLALKTKYFDLFHNKTWVQIKVFIYNTYRNS